MKIRKDTDIIKSKKDHINYITEATKDIFSSKWFPYAIILAITLIAYINSLNAPFTLDDFSSIEDNNAIHNLLDIGAIWKFYTNRFIVYLSFAINYAIHGTSVMGYHIVNILLHYFNGILVYLLIIKLLENPVFSINKPKKKYKLIAITGSLLFICHPLQINAVTYIVQRTAALATAFSLLSIYLYLQFRLRDKWKYFLFSVFFLVAAMFTKENTITIPFMIFLFEALLFRKRKSTKPIKMAVIISVLMISVLIIPCTNIVFNGYNQSDPGNTFKASTSMNRMHYFYTQQNVIVTYLRQFFVPDNLCFDYSDHIPLSKTILENNSWQSMILLIAIGIFGIACLFINKLSFIGIAWLFIGLSVESSFISIKDVYFEHRMYFPIIGIIIFIIGIFIGWSNSTEERLAKLPYIWKTPLKSCVIALTIMTVLYLPITIYRNYLFSNSIRLWSDVVKKAPNSSRGHSVLATAYLDEYEYNGMIPANLEMAEQEFLESLKLNPRNSTSLCNLAKVYLFAGRIDECIETAEKALNVKKSVYAYHHLGQAYRQKGDFNKAIDVLLKGYKLDSNISFVLEALGDAYSDAKDFDNARVYYEKFLEIYYGPEVEEKLDAISTVSTGTIP